MTSDSRLTAFISSTGVGLPEVRDAARDGCLAAGVLPLMTEFMPATDSDIVESIGRMIDQADIFVLILGWRYGYIPVGTKYSVAELEYRRALERKMPVFAFFADPTFPVPSVEVERGAKGNASLRRFKTQVSADRLVGVFRSVDDLKAQISTQLHVHRQRLLSSAFTKTVIERQEDGWVSVKDLVSRLATPEQGVAGMSAQDAHLVGNSAPGQGERPRSAHRPMVGKSGSPKPDAQAVAKKSIRSTRASGRVPKHVPTAKTSTAHADAGRTGQVLRVFVASPKDVQPERERMPRVVATLNQTLGALRPVVIELWRWEINAPPNVGEPQDLIDPELDKADVVVVILWNRLGLKTAKGTTGTESEVLRSMRRWRKTGRPAVMIYFCTRPSNLDRDGLQQRLMLMDLKDKLEGLALTKEFESSDDFERAVYRDAFTVLAQMAADASQRV